MHYEDITIELARTERELYARVCAKIAARQLGEAWEGLDDRRAEPEPGRRLLHDGAEDRVLVPLAKAA